jgi:hypothetical protein
MRTTLPRLPSAMAHCQRRPQVLPPLETPRTARWTSSRKLPEIVRLLRESAATASLIPLEKRVRPVAGNGSPIAWLRSAATIFFAGRRWSRA